MKRGFILGAVTAASVIAYRCLPQASRDRLAAAIKDRMMKRCERMMASLPEEAPPKLIMSILPKLQAQNDQIIALLREQNELLRERQHAYEHEVTR
jgi:hypothetical protein